MEIYEVEASVEKLCLALAGRSKPNSALVCINGFAVRSSDSNFLFAECNSMRATHDGGIIAKESPHTSRRVTVASLTARLESACQGINYSFTFDNASSLSQVESSSTFVTYAQSSLAALDGP